MVTEVEETGFNFAHDIEFVFQGQDLPNQGSLVFREGGDLHRGFFGCTRWMALRRVPTSSLLARTEVALPLSPREGSSHKAPHFLCKIY